MHTVISGYWVARNILSHEVEVMVSEFSLTKLQAFAWKMNAPHKLCHLTWHMVSGYLAVIRNFTFHHMQCDNHFPRCGEPDESVNNAIFEYPLQIWTLTSTPL